MPGKCFSLSCEQSLCLDQKVTEFECPEGLWVVTLQTVELDTISKEEKNVSSINAQVKENPECLVIALKWHEGNRFLYNKALPGVPFLASLSALISSSRNTNSLVQHLEKLHIAPKEHFTRNNSYSYICDDVKCMKHINSLH